MRLSPALALLRIVYTRHHSSQSSETSHLQALSATPIMLFIMYLQCPHRLQAIDVAFHVYMRSTALCKQLRRQQSTPRGNTGTESAPLQCDIAHNCKPTAQALAL